MMRAMLVNSCGIRNFHFIVSLPDFVGPDAKGAICGRERTSTHAESAIRPRFVPESFHTLRQHFEPSHCGTKPKDHAPTMEVPSAQSGRNFVMNRKTLEDAIERVETSSAARWIALLGCAAAIEARHSQPSHANGRNDIDRDLKAGKTDVLQRISRSRGCLRNFVRNESRL